MFWAIWIFVPLLVADCISRERREGTLGLLFLTRLRSTGIVSAKGLAHALRAGGLWLAVVPILVIPILMGGVNPQGIMFSLLLELSAISWALAAGLLASAWSKTHTQAMVCAAVFAGTALLAMGIIAGGLWVAAVPTPFFEPQNASFVSWCGVGFDLLSARTVGGVMRLPGSPLLGQWPNVLPALGFWRNITPVKISLSPVNQFIWAASELAIFSLLALFLAILVAGWKIQRSFQDKQPSRLRFWWERTCCTPRFWRALLKRWMEHKLDKNPIGWLGQRTWRGRAMTWGWLAVPVVYYSIVLSWPRDLREELPIEKSMIWLLVGSMALAASGSYRRERDNGVMELLLVSPLTEGKIILGRLRGLYGQFLLSFALLLGLGAYLRWVAKRAFMDSFDPDPFIFFACSFLCLPAIGLYFSLRWRNFISASIWTFLVAFPLPLVLSVVFRYAVVARSTLLAFPEDFGPRPALHAAVWQFFLAVLCLVLLYRRLKGRKFSFERASR
ncbi:MAG: hypothetical protein C5B50_14000 [Verrucomicrobia bacterium]|nr:MAG: hypothetical protein C5B50_14000 [Verrucomicrobiota bacterium]